MNVYDEPIVSREFQALWDSDVGKASVLEQLFDDQVALNLIPESTIANISSSHRFEKDGCTLFRLQYNPQRLNRGTSEMIHPNPRHTIPFRGGIPCFCCTDVIAYQWPNERGVMVKIGGVDRLILPNVSPIFIPHFTVISRSHEPQYMDWVAGIDLATQVPQCWVIQNGPGAGATNPWHYHLQLFMDDTLPIANRPRIPLKTGISLVVHPALIIRIDSTSKSSFETMVSEIGDHYLAQSDTRRVNVIIRHHSTGWMAFLVLRDTQFNTSQYRSGQPGYAEAAGVISAITEESLNTWMIESAGRYCQLMDDIRPKGPDIDQWIADLGR